MKKEGGNSGNSGKERKGKEMDWWRKGTEAVGKENDERWRRKVCFGVKGREAGKCYRIVEERKGMRKEN